MLALDGKTTMGKGKSVPWPTGIGAPGNEGVSGSIKSTPNSIGYIELVICSDYRYKICIYSK